jgi:hypothetical protein
MMERGTVYTAWLPANVRRKCAAAGYARVGPDLGELEPMIYCAARYIECDRTLLNSACRSVGDRPPSCKRGVAHAIIALHRCACARACEGAWGVPFSAYLSASRKYPAATDLPRCASFSGEQPYTTVPGDLAFKNL